MIKGSQEIKRWLLGSLVNWIWWFYSVFIWNITKVHRFITIRDEGTLRRLKFLDLICIMLYWKIFWHGFVAVKLFNFSHKAFYFEHIFVGKTSCNFDIIDVRINKIQLNIKKKFLCWQFDAICWLKKATKHWIISEIR